MPDPYAAEADCGMSHARRRHLTRFLRMFMREVRWLLRRNRGTEVGPRGDRCRSCALQPGTDSDYGVRVKGVGYLPPLDPAKLRPCAGWISIEVGADARERVEAMARRASDRAGNIPA